MEVVLTNVSRKSGRKALERNLRGIKEEIAPLGSRPRNRRSRAKSSLAPAAFSISSILLPTARSITSSPS